MMSYRHMHEKSDQRANSPVTQTSKSYLDGISLHRATQSEPCAMLTTISIAITDCRASFWRSSSWFLRILTCTQREQRNPETTAAQPAEGHVLRLVYERHGDLVLMSDDADPGVLDVSAGG